MIPVAFSSLGALPPQFPMPTINISLSDLPDLEILRGKESELNWEARDRLLNNLSVFFAEQKEKLDYSLTGMANFSGSFADLRASFQALPANDPRFVISGWIKNYYDDIMLIVKTNGWFNRVLTLCSYIHQGLN